MEPRLGTDLTARQVFELILPVLVDAGPDATCESLINFLTLALVQLSLVWKAPWIMQSQTGRAGYVPVPMTSSYRREHALYLHSPVLFPGSITPAVSDPALVDVDRGMRDMVAEARAE
jgi:hypothetical protein